MQNSSELCPEIVDEFFYNDVNKWLNLNCVIIHLSIITKEKVGRIFHENRSLKQFETILVNLNEIKDEFFTGNPEKYPDPLDQYIHISNCGEAIFLRCFKNVAENDDFDLFHDVLKFKCAIKYKFKNLGLRIVEEGLKHKFKDAYYMND